MNSFRLLAVLTALALLGGCLSVGEIRRRVDEARLVARIGVVAAPKVKWAKDALALRKALAVFAQEKADVVVVIGELTADGYANQYGEFAALWQKVMPPETHLIAVRGFAEAKVSAADAPFVPGARLVDPAGGTFEVNGFRFHASFAKTYAKASGVPGFFFGRDLALTDELGFHPRSALSMTCGSLSGIEPSDYYDRDFDLGNVSQGLFVKVYSDEVRIHRLDFSSPRPSRRKGKGKAGFADGAEYAEEVAPAWTLVRAPDGTCRSEPEDGSAPRFWADTNLQVVRGDDGHQTGYTVRFPQVLAKFTGVRAFSYEIRCGKEVRNVLPRDFHRSEDWVDGPVEYLFRPRRSDGGRAPLTFTVTPVSSLGVRGPSLSATVGR